MASKHQYKVTFNYKGHYQPAIMTWHERATNASSITLDRFFDIVFYCLWDGKVSYVGCYSNIMRLVNYWFHNDEETIVDFLDKNLEVFHDE